LDVGYRHGLIGGSVAARGLPVCETIKLMKPLHWPDFYQAEPSELKSTWERLPLIGWLFSSSDYHPVINSVREQLLARPKPDRNVWGNDLARQEMGQ